MVPDHDDLVVTKKAAANLEVHRCFGSVPETVALSSTGGACRRQEQGRQEDPGGDAVKEGSESEIAEDEGAQARKNEKGEKRRPHSARSSHDADRVLTPFLTLSSNKTTPRHMVAMTQQPQQHAFNPYTENGGTILAIAGADFTVIAGDTRQSEGYSIQTRYAPKVFKLTDKAVLAVNGFAADGNMFVKKVKQRLEWYRHAHAKDMPIRSIARLIQTMLYARRFFPYYVYNILGGIEEDGTGAVYSFDPVGSYEREACRAAGAAQALVQPFLDNQVSLIAIPHFYPPNASVRVRRVPICRSTDRRDPDPFHDVTTRPLCYPPPLLFLYHRFPPSLTTPSTRLYLPSNQTPVA
ncbi:hypothetical protein NMY22_g17382 [Coprinellus aureogranulatus]|nr:hypothetical protein NMY22_g17382 [Coprinellus aureogranulatus]